MVQRYKFESKSQPVWTKVCRTFSCFQWFKDTNLKVNHNIKSQQEFVNTVVSNGSKIQI